jgi:hypothetical protein
VPAARTAVTDDEQFRRRFLELIMTTQPHSRLIRIDEAVQSCWVTFC